MGRVRAWVAALSVVALGAGTLAGVAASGLLAESAAAAMAFTVSSNLDTGGLCPTPSTCTLRQAFDSASATAGDSEIDIPAIVPTIDLAGGELLYNGTGNLSVVGNGNTVDQMTSGARVITSTTSGTLTVSGLTLTGGNVNPGVGGAIETNGDLTIANSTVTGNAATGNTASTLRVGSNRTNALVLTNTTVSSNTATATGTNDNGGILDSGITTLTNSTVSNNTDSTTGSGNAEGTLDTLATTITGGTVSGNHTTAGTGSAEGTLDTLNLTMTAVTVTGNTNTAGGSGDANGTLDTLNVTMTGSNVSGNTNTAAGTGDANGVFDSTATTLTGSSVVGNTNSATAGSAFGGIDASSVTATNSTISANTSSGASSTGGGIDDGPAPGARAAATSGPSGKHDRGSVSSQAAVGTVLVYVTIAGNQAQTGANIDSSSVLTSFGSVVALGNGGANCVLTGPPTISNGWNWSNDTSCGFTNTASGDHQGPGDPLLGAAANNGGPGPTQLPQVGSPLIDAIPNASCQADGASGITTDERGLPRPDSASPNCDIGAVEVQPTALVVTAAFTG